MSTESSEQDAGTELAAGLQTLHRSVLALLAACALSAWLSGDPELADAAPPRDWTLAAVGLAVGIIATRRLASSPVIGLRASVRLGIASLVLAGALGLLAAALSWQFGASQSALVFALAAAVFVLRPPTLPASPAPDR